jgi:hypothetical protein
LVTLFDIPRPKSCLAFSILSELHVSRYSLLAEVRRSRSLIYWLRFFGWKKYGKGKYSNSKNLKDSKIFKIERI